MSKEIDDFLFSPAPVMAPVAQPAQQAPQAQAPASAPPRAAASAPQPSAPQPAASQPIAPPSLPPVMANAPAMPPPPFNPGNVPMPKAEEIAPQVAQAASAARAAAPALEVKSPVKSLTEEVTSNWVPFGIGLAGAGAAMLAVKGAKALLQNRSLKGAPAGGTGTPQVGSPTTNPAVADRVEPVFASAEETAASEAAARDLAEQRQRRLAQFDQLFADRPANVAAAAQTLAPVEPPAAQAETSLVPNPNRTNPWDPEMIEVKNAPVIAEEAPKTAVAIETNQPGSQVAEAVVKDELLNPTPAEPAAAEGEKTVAGRTRRTKAQIAAEQAALVAAAPPGMHPTYKKGPGQMGPGAYNWVYGQEGERAPGVWQELFGQKNLPYSPDAESELQSKYLAYKQSVAEPGTGLGELSRVGGGGINKAPKYVPEFIKGRAAPGGLAGLGALAAALGIAGSEKGREAMGRAAAAIKDLGISPDIFQGKGEEIGRLGQGYVTAGNPAYLRELSQQLETEVDPNRRAILMREFQKAGGSAGGRGIAPPMR